MEEEQQTSRPLRRHPTKKDWTRLRPRAEQLYKVQKRKIDDVVEVLQEENGLRITLVSEFCIFVLLLTLVKGSACLGNVRRNGTS